MREINETNFWYRIWFRRTLYNFINNQMILPNEMLLTDKIKCVEHYMDRETAAFDATAARED